MNFLVTAENLRFSYPGRLGFSLEVNLFAPGECTALIGPNGSGKTTLGKLLTGLLKPDSGRICYDGFDIAALKLGEIGAQVGYLFQEPSRQIFAPRVLEELTFPLTMRGIPKELAEQKAKEAIREFELEKIENEVTYTLSRGEKQRLAIAAAMVCEPKFFVFDEPTTGLDARRRDIFATLLGKLTARGVGLLLISHDMAFIKQVGADVRRMDRGCLLDE